MLNVQENKGKAMYSQKQGNIINYYLRLLINVLLLLLITHTSAHTQLVAVCELQKLANSVTC